MLAAAAMKMTLPTLVLLVVGAKPIPEENLPQHLQVQPVTMDEMSHSVKAMIAQNSVIKFNDQGHFAEVVAKLFEDSESAKKMKDVCGFTGSYDGLHFQAKVASFNKYKPSKVKYTVGGAYAGELKMSDEFKMEGSHFANGATSSMEVLLLPATGFLWVETGVGATITVRTWVGKCKYGDIVFTIDYPASGTDEVHVKMNELLLPIDIKTMGKAGESNAHQVQILIGEGSRTRPQLLGADGNLEGFKNFAVGTAKDMLSKAVDAGADAAIASVLG